MMTGRESWFDAEAGPLVRPYALTRGRTRADRHDLNMITLVIAMSEHWDGMEPEYGHIVRHCQRPKSVAEVAAHLDLPMAVVKVLISDLIEDGHLIFRSPPRSDDLPDLPTLLAVLDGIRKL